ncbi:zinc transporter ZIP9 isoform X1 [Agrilus planipennis]|uniref:Zinc transporter ZIP9 isoform X1 n=1 Tax=Agrilus planipennis TaxID=224129 RepID=A0A1W4WF44_AGRPL|nr:zinc transporter ZIP9 isoform X2 [Agrilus planipennis]XP_025834282.1 zinc transporter ZIP9 isoform X1 [Agrilus planipennis]
MEETLMLVSLVVVMLIGSYLAGSIPLFMSLSEETLKKVTVFGSGLLVGTALAVIIPEGVRSLTTSIHVKEGANETHTAQKVNDPLSVIGISLILGFVLMLLIDQISQRRNESLNPSERNITATIGLVVHAAADGVALGAAATTSHTDVEIIVFLAIMLHKAPAAFGLVTFLLHEGIERQRIRRHLIIFSLAAPLLALVTYFGIGQEQKERFSSVNGTGIAMLFSAGTFLYVATVHVLADLTQKGHQTHHSSYSRLQNVENGAAPVAKVVTPQSLAHSELIILIVGCLVPLFLTLVHHH